MKNPILLSLLLLSYFPSKSQTLTVKVKQDSAGKYSMDLKGDEGIIIHDGEYTVNDALHDCDSANQVKIKRLSMNIYNYEFNVIPALKKEILNLKMRKK